MSKAPSLRDISSIIERLPTSHMQDVAKRVWDSTATIEEPTVRAAAIQAAVRQEGRYGAAVPALAAAFRAMEEFAGSLIRPKEHTGGGSGMMAAAAAKPDVN